MGLVSNALKKDRGTGDENNESASEQRRRQETDNKETAGSAQDFTPKNVQRTPNLAESQNRADEKGNREQEGNQEVAQEVDRPPNKVICIDDRIGSKDLHPIMLSIAASNPTPVLTKQYAGDVVWEGNGPRGQATMAIERKRVGDLVNSLVSGRLVGHQIPALYDAGHEFIWLVVEGYYRPHPVSGILQEWDDRTSKGYWRDIRLGRNGSYMWRDLENWLTTLRLFTGVLVEKTRSAHETAQLAVGLFRYFQKEWKDHKSHFNFHHSGPGTAVFHKPNIVARIAKEFDGIGWEKAMQVATKFKTPDEMFGASRKDWLEIPGMGKVIVQRVFEEKTTGLTREKKKDS